MFEFILFLIINLILTSFLITKIKYKIYTPIYLFIQFNYITILLSILYFYIIPNEKKINLFNFDLISNQDFNIQLSFSLISLIFFQFGALVLAFFLKKRKIKLRIRKDAIKEKNNSLIFFILSFLFVYLFLSIYGIDGIMERNKYLPENVKIFEILLLPVTLLLSIQIGKLYKKKKIISLILICMLMLLEFSTASRKGVIYLILYFITIFPYIKTSINRIIYYVLFICSVLFFQLSALKMRGTESHGLIPYLSQLLDSFFIYIDGFNFLIYYTFIFGSFVSVQTIEMNNFTDSIFIISINPLPGFMTNWYSVLDEVKILPIAPQNLYGQIYSKGYIYIIPFFVFLGIISSYIDIKIRNIVMKNKRIAILLTLLYLLFVVYSFEYPMRSAIRFIYYIIFILGIYKVYLLFKFKKFKWSQK